MTIFLPFLHLALAFLEPRYYWTWGKVLLKLAEYNLCFMKSFFFCLKNFFNAKPCLLLNISPELCLLQLNFLFNTLVDPETVIVGNHLLFIQNLIEDLALFRDLIVEIIEASDAVVLVLAEQGAMRTYFLLIRHTNDIHADFMNWTELLFASFEACWSCQRWSFNQQLIFFLLGNDLMRMAWCGFRKRHEQCSIESKNSDFCLFENSRAESANDDFLFGVNNFSQTSLTYAVGTARKLARQSDHVEVQQTLTTFLRC